jgi:hypothetical protein
LLLLPISIRNAHKALLATLFVAPIFIAGCQGNDPDNFTITVEALAKPNQYQSHLKWNVNDDEGDHWIIQRQSDKKPLHTVATVSHDAHDYVDTTVVAGSTYHYGLVSGDSGTTTVKRSLDITVPRDLSIVGVTALPTVNGIGRLIIPKGSKIVTNGTDIDITVEQIISDGGVIETFPEGQAALLNTPGRAGGKVGIHARTGIGTLYVVARGENGGASTAAGSQGGPGVPGLPGNNGNCGFQQNDAVCGASQSEYDNIVNKCKDNNLFSPPFCKILSMFYCKTQPGNGGQGSQGYPGGQGGIGFYGGDSGNIMVEIADPTNIQIVPTSIAGLGGPGGPGGPGGVGGNGGIPGVADHLHICAGAAGPGAQGPAGPAGHTGPNGASGIKGAVCLKFGANSTGDCSHF